MKKTLIFFLVFFTGYVLFSRYQGTTVDEPDQVLLPQQQNDALLAKAFADRTSNLQVEGQGVVEKILADDQEGSRHQRFLLKLASGQTLLVAHNIDLAPRLDALAVGDEVHFFGEYEWNNKGGVVHWTHNDPDGRHVAGWLRHKGKKFQ